MNEIKSPLVVIIPAHNEEAGIQETIESIAQCSFGTVVVIADNCTDHTAEIAKSCGVRVLERNDPEKRGKPYALSFALSLLLTEDFDFFVFVDADTVVEKNFISTLLEEFALGAEAVQVRYAQRQSHPSFPKRLLDIAFTASNTLKPLGRQYWGLSCGILGNGFALTRQTLLKAPLQTTSLVEDLVYHTELVRQGIFVTYTTKTTVRAVIPLHKEAATTQHSRWMAGRLAAIKTQVPLLFAEALRGRASLIEPLLDLLLLPLALHALLILCLFFLSPPALQGYAIFAAGAIAIYCLVALYIRREGWRDWAALCLGPLYILWKISLIPHIIQTLKTSLWVRTDRTKEHK